MKIKIERSQKVKSRKKKKIRTVSVGKHRKMVLVFWLLLICSITFGFYKNFTAIDQHTTHEKVVVKEKVLNTSGIENFTIDFAKEYFSWKNDKEVIEKRISTLKQYLTENVLDLSQDMIRTDIPTSSEVTSVEILNVEKRLDKFIVSFLVDQKIKEDKISQMRSLTYRVSIFEDSKGGCAVTELPTMIEKLGKADYEIKQLEGDSKIDFKKKEEITSFLETFFKLYPTASEKELKYYVEHDALRPINSKLNYKEIVAPIYQEKGKSIQASFVVKYLDDISKTTTSFQYVLILQKDKTWKIIDNKI